MTLEWSNVSGDKQLNESVPSQIGLHVMNNGRGTAVNVSWRLEWPGWGFSSSLATMDFPVGLRHPVAFGRLEREDNDVLGAKIVVSYEDAGGKELKQAWIVEIENTAGACHLGAAVPGEELA